MEIGCDADGEAIEIEITKGDLEPVSSAISDSSIPMICEKSPNVETSNKTKRKCTPDESDQSEEEEDDSSSDEEKEKINRPIKLRSKLIARANLEAREKIEKKHNKKTNKKHTHLKLVIQYL